MLSPQTNKSYRSVRIKHLASFVVALVACSITCGVDVDAFQPAASPWLSRTSPQLNTVAISSSRSIGLWHQRHHLRATQMKMYERNSNNLTPSAPLSSTKVTAVYGLILINLGVYLVDKVFHIPFVTRKLYLFHSRWSWWQPLTTCFCHGDRSHLSSNLFLLLLFGRSVEDDLGWGGLIFSYIFCGVMASFASLLLLPSRTVSIGASGAVFGLFAVSTLAKLSLRELLDWRKVVEVAVLGEFVFRQLITELSTAARGGRWGINHVAHLSGAAAGIMMVMGMRVTVARFERSEKIRRGKGRIT